MKRFTWWRMEQDAHHLSRALCGAFCSILHHVKRFMSQPPYSRCKKRSKQRFQAEVIRRGKGVKKLPNCVGFMLLEYFCASVLACVVSSKF